MPEDKPKGDEKPKVEKKPEVKKPKVTIYRGRQKFDGKIPADKLPPKGDKKPA
jgi:hypothetical protein